MRIHGQPPGQDHLLLITATQIPDGDLERRRGDAQQFNVPFGDLVLLLPAKELEPTLTDLKSQLDLLALKMSQVDR